MGSWNKGIKGRLLLLGTIPILALMVLAYLSVSSVRSLSGDMKVMGSQRIPITQSIGYMTTNMNAAYRFAWRAVVLEGRPEERAQSIKIARDHMASFDAAFDSLGKLAVSAQTKEKMAQISTPWKSSSDILNRVFDLLQKNDKASDIQARELMIESLMKPSTAITGALKDVEESATSVTARLTAAAVELAGRLENTSLATSVISILFTAAFAFFIATRLASSLSRMAGVIGDAGTQVGAASSQLSGASQQLSSGSSEAASSLEETVASLEELSSMVKQNAENAKEAGSLSQKSRETAELGEEQIRSLISAMSEMGAGAKKIEEIINVIDDIAFQTNLLALNAAVEAARAGEQGKGFAVVAEAVRTLAQRSAGAAKDITGLIKENVDKAEHGAQAAEGSGKVLKEIVTSAKKVADLNAEISSACQEQSTGLSQISKAMNQLDQATQTNAASAEEVAASSEELSSQAHQLREYVIELRSIVAGSAAVADSGAYAGASHLSHRHEPKSARAQLKVIRGGGAKAKQQAAEAIPFDNEIKKVGTTDGF